MFPLPTNPPQKRGGQRGAGRQDKGWIPPAWGRPVLYHLAGKAAQERLGGVGQSLGSGKGSLASPAIPMFPGTVLRKGSSSVCPPWYQASALVTAQRKAVVPSRWGPPPTYTEQER